MNNLFERLVNLLGTPIDNPAFQEFLKDCGEEPDLIELKTMKDYSFSKLGLNIDMDKMQNQIKSIFLHLNTVAVQGGEIEPFAQSLPFSISLDDSRDAVKDKIGVKRKARKIQGRTPTEPKDFWDSYEIHPLEYTFVFNGDNNRLSSISVHFAFNPIPPLPPPQEPDEYLKFECSLKMLEALKFAQKEARNLRHNSIGSEFLLLGLLGNDSSIAATVLRDQKISKMDVRDGVTKIIGVGNHKPNRKTIPFTPQAKVILQGARTLSKQLDSPKIKITHCLLSIIESEGVGIRTLNNLGVDLKRLKEDVHRLIKEG